MPAGVICRPLDEIYKRTLLAANTPRRGDFAEIVRDHHRTETGLLVRVVNDPHLCEQYCAECGQKVVAYFVEVQSPQFDNVPGPHFYPVQWLRRFDPARDPLRRCQSTNAGQTH